uniref:Retrotransposon gag domain-containing protein n=1 Tax=Bracon brevicornis TaxID=1563983 RepID=A0A6V7JKA4_9HYME
MNLMQKWDLTPFSDKRGEDIEHFISRIEERLACFTVADETILRVLPFYLRGGALTWFRGHATQLTMWERTRENLRSRYGDPDYQRTLRCETDQRTQGDQEAIGDYFACMQGLFARLDPPWTEREQVETAHANLLPAYRVWLRINRHTTLNELEEMAIQQESVYNGCEKRKPPPTPEASMCPTYAYQLPKERGKAQPRLSLKMLEADAASTDSKSGSDEEAEDNQDEVDPALIKEVIKALRWKSKGKFPAKAQKTVPKSNQTSRSAPLPAAEAAGQAGPSRQQDKKKPAGSALEAMEFFNCRKRGYLFRDCPEKLRLFCHRCGESGVSTRKCLYCNEAPRVNPKSAESGSQDGGSTSRNTAKVSRSFHAIVTVENKPSKALVDIGASLSFVRERVIDFLTKIGIKPYTVAKRKVITVAGHQEVVQEAYKVKVLLDDRGVTLGALALKPLSEDIILGLETLSSVGMIIDFQAQTRWYRGEPTKVYPFAPAEQALRVLLCCGLKTPDAQEAKRLESLLDECIAPNNGEIGTTKLTEHVIDVENSPPIKQKPRHVTPALRETM